MQPVAKSFGSGPDITGLTSPYQNVGDRSCQTDEAITVSAAFNDVRARLTRPCCGQRLAVRWRAMPPHLRADEGASSAGEQAWKRPTPPFMTRHVGAAPAGRIVGRPLHRRSRGRGSAIGSTMPQVVSPDVRDFTHRQQAVRLHPAAAEA